MSSIDRPDLMDEIRALQATVFRASQAVEVVSRATDKLVGAVKQTVGTQV